jgi:hypothetical protein
MRSAAQQEGEPPPGRPDLEAMAADGLKGNAALIAKALAVLARVAAAPGNTEPAALLDELRRLSNEIVLDGLHLSELRAELPGIAAAQYSAERMWAAGYAAGLAACEAEAAPGKGTPGPRHAKRGLRVVPALVPAGGLVAAVKGAWAAHHAAAVAVTTAAVPAVALAASAALAPAPAVPAVAHEAAPGVSGPAAVTPVPAGVVAAPSARPGTDAARARKAGRHRLTHLDPPSSPAAAVPPPSLPPSPLPAVLAVSSTVLDLGPRATGQVELSAPEGAVSWSVGPAPGVTFSASSGVLAAGASVPLVITVTDPTQAGSATVTFWPGGTVVQVTWTAVPDPGGSPTVPVP